MSGFKISEGKDSGRSSAMTTTNPTKGKAYRYAFHIVDMEGTTLWAVFGADKKRVIKRGRKSLRDNFTIKVSESETRVKEYRKSYNGATQTQFVFFTSKTRIVNR